MSPGPAANSAFAEKAAVGICVVSIGTISTLPSNTQTVGGRLAAAGENRAGEAAPLIWRCISNVYQGNVNARPLDSPCAETATLVLSHFNQNLKK